MKESSTEEANRVVTGHKLLGLIAAGHSLRKSAEALDVPYTTAQRYYRATLAEHAAEHVELRENILQQELETLRLLMVPHMKKATGGDEKSARIVLSVLERRAKLLGLDEAIKIKVEGQKVERALEIATQAVNAAAAPMELNRVSTLPEDEDDRDL